MKVDWQQLRWILVLLFFCAFPAQAAEETYTLDPQHTYVLWHINHFGFSNPAGKWYATGILTLDADKPQKSKVTATIQIANIDTGIKELDEHLKGKLFFDVEKFPVATFISNKIVLTGKKTAKIQGMLTLHGVTKPIILNAIFNKAGVNPINNKQTVGFSATAKLKRSDFDINTLLPELSDEVFINIEAEAYKNS